ncbi:MAG: 16S rRNA (uracil(1498)-N(3))-methyltransferase [Clostridiales bacterium]|jgi:16S rRNA (uracil1498-N3)-methyltransferase|nr:16S rRNA (uracil(1498)-N(3))-methyltransferase [Clostridiales bacterium]
MHRFFTDKPVVDSSAITLSDGDARHINVLRVRKGDEIDVRDGSGARYICAVEEIGLDEVSLSILSKEPLDVEPSLKITLFQGLPKSDKMELIIQKCVELGVYEIIPVETERCVSRVNEKSARKTRRWREIAKSAAEQCGRGFTPSVKESVSFRTAIEEALRLKNAFMAYENESDVSIADMLKDMNTNEIGVFIGPEGGFSAAETELCAEKGIPFASLGRRIYRTETAGFVAIIALLLLRGEL